MFCTSLISPLAMRAYNPVAEERIRKFRSQNIPILSKTEQKPILPPLCLVKRSSPDINLHMEEIEYEKLPSLYNYKNPMPKAISITSSSSSL